MWSLASLGSSSASFFLLHILAPLRLCALALSLSRTLGTAAHACSLCRIRAIPASNILGYSSNARLGEAGNERKVEEKERERVCVRERESARKNEEKGGSNDKLPNEVIAKVLP